MFNKINAEELKKIVHDIELQAREENKKELDSLKNRLIELREKYTDLENKYIKLQQENEILKYRLKEFNNKPKEDVEKLADELFA
jgi:polyhydroxyalkanoate synthesis regulator phasin